MATRRLEQLNEQFREEISDVIRRRVQDPGVSGIVSITTVDVSPDLHHARVYVSALGAGDERDKAIAGLQRAAGFIRRELAQRLKLRHVPDLIFKPDVSLERGERIMELLREIKHEEPPAEPAEPASGEAAQRDGEEPDKGDADRGP